MVAEALGSAFPGGGGLFLAANARLFVVLVLTCFGKDAGLLRGLLKAA